MNADYLYGFAGGMLIGLAALMMIGLHGKIAGISGILGGLLRSGQGQAWRWRLSFLAGLPLGAACIRLFKPGIDVQHVAAGGWLLLAGGLVGVGTVLGSGCTSGHGICGLSRFSPRSMAATLTFMGMAFLTAWVVKEVLA